MRSKSRKLSFPLGEGWTRVWEYRDRKLTSTYLHKPKPPTPFGSQVTDSENHHWPAGKGTGDVGGNFFTQKKFIVSKPTKVSDGCRQVLRGSEPDPADWSEFRINGTVLPLAPPYEQYFPSARDSSTATLNGVGTKAVALSAPTNSLVNLSTFLAEILREGVSIPLANSWKDGTRRARRGEGLRPDLNVADEYLNAQFGWKPIVSDIQRVAKQIAWAEDIISQFERDAGRLVRRRFDFPIVTSSTYDEADEYKYPQVVGIYSSYQMSPSAGGGVTCYSTKFSQRRWFSGAFTYHLPSDWNSRRAMRNARNQIRQVLNADITAETMWNLTPWSWAIDWFSSAGDVVHNLSAWSKYGLVMRYGYIMEHTLCENTYTRKFTTPVLRSGVKPSPSSMSFYTETKKRIGANPFGFGVSWDGLTPFQLSIAAALGIKKGG